MQQVTIIRGQNGVVVWTQVKTAPEQFAWQCLRDSFRVQVPLTQAGLEEFVVSVAQHSAVLVGTISQVIQLEI